MEVSSDVEKLKRKLRKKLRQIENLEVLERELNDEELDKIRKKAEIRAELGELVRLTEKVVTEEEEESDTDDAMKRAHENIVTYSDDSPAEKKVCTEVLGNSSDTQPEPVNHFSETEVKAELLFRVEGLENVETGDDDSITESNGGWQMVSASKHDESSQPQYSSRVLPETKQESQSSVQTQYSTEECQPSTEPQPSSQSQPTTKQSKPIAKQSQPTNKQPQLSTKNIQASVSKQTSTSIAKPAKDLEAEKIKREGWAVAELVGHEDLVLDCDLDSEQGLVVTCSRDTTVKVWSLESSSLLHSLRGHTGSVTGLRLLSTRQTNNLRTDDEERQLRHVAVSGSQDCSLKVWDLELGHLVTSTYTYNGITRLVVLPVIAQALTGTDGGKLELFCLASSTCLVSQRVHDDCVTALTIKQEGEGKFLVASGGKDGVVKLFRMENSSLSCLFVSEDVKTETDITVHTRPVCCVEIAGSNLLYFGDHGCNLKVLDWRRNNLGKVSNHQQDLGFTDCLAREGGIVVASTYDIDTGEGGVNIFREGEKGPRYLTTLREEDEGRVLSLAVRGQPGNLVVVTCGQEVKVWRLGAGGRVKGKILNLSQRLDSGSEGDDDLTEEEEEEDDEDRTKHNEERSENLPYSDKTSGFCNCRLM